VPPENQAATVSVNTERSHPQVGQVSEPLQPSPAGSDPTLALFYDRRAAAVTQA